MIQCFKSCRNFLLGSISVTVTVTEILNAGSINLYVRILANFTSRLSQIQSNILLRHRASTSETQSKPQKLNFRNTHFIWVKVLTAQCNSGVTLKKGGMKRMVRIS